MLHHDGCVAAAAGRRQPLERTAAEVAAFLAKKGLAGIVHAGSVVTETNKIVW